MWRCIWNDYVEVACSAFNLSPAHAKVLLIALFTCVGVMIASTWFIWVGIIVAVLAALTVLFSIEYALRTWYWLHNNDWQREFVPPPVPLERSAPSRLRTPCADSQGRIEKNDLRGYAIDAMAAQILREATMRKTWYRKPSWLHFPAICRAMPILGRIGRVINMVYRE